MFRTLRSRLLLTYLFIIATVLSVIGVSFLVLLRPLVEGQLYRDLNLIGTVVALRSDRALPVLPRENLRLALRTLGLADTRLILIDSGGAIVADNQPGEPAPRPELLADLAGGGAVTRGRLLDTAGGPWLYVARPQGQGSSLLTLSPRPPLRTLAALGRELIAPWLRAGLIALVASMLFAWLISRWVAGPLQRMSLAARSVAAGEFRPGPTPGGPQEVESLALAFNDMIRKVQTSQQSQRDFVANVSHELKTPLTSIQGFAQAILDGTAGDDEARRRAAGVIYDDADRLRRLVEDLLDLARLDAGQVEFRREPMALPALLENVVERQRLHAAEKGLRIDLHVDGIPTLLGDGDRLAQVFTNLIDNAIRYTPEGGRVAIAAVAEDGWVRIHVSDNGPGIPQAEASRIFERFYRVDKARSGGSERGAGLGLAITREIVLAHGGEIGVESAPGAGTRFTVSLPLARPDDETLARPLRRG